MKSSVEGRVSNATKKNYKKKHGKICSSRGHFSLPRGPFKARKTCPPADFQVFPGLILEEHIFAEYFIHLVDPPIDKSDLLLTNALNKHFDGKKWHFYSNKINAVMNSSKVIEKLKKVKPKFPFTTE